MFVCDLKDITWSANNRGKKVRNKAGSLQAVELLGIFPMKTKWKKAVLPVKSIEWTHEIFSS